MTDTERKLDALIEEIVKERTNHEEERTNHLRRQFMLVCKRNNQRSEMQIRDVKIIPV